jgi:hypothetical protein
MKASQIKVLNAKAITLTAEENLKQKNYLTNLVVLGKSGIFSEPLFNNYCQSK